MGFSLPEYLTAQFYAWEQRGRGWKLFDDPVHLEPDFIPFFGHILPERKTAVDSGRRPRFFPEFQEALGFYKKPTGDPFGEDALTELEELYPINAYVFESDDSVIEFQINFEKDTRIPFETIEQFLLMLSCAHGIICFELVGKPDKIEIQIVSTESNRSHLITLINSYVPGVSIRESSSNLKDSLDFEKEIYGLDLGLREEFMRPLRVWTKFDPDPLLNCTSTLESIEAGEFGVLQVLFQPAVNPWPESIYRAVTDGKGDAFFADSSDMVPLAKEKISHPLFAVCIRAVGQASTEERATKIATQIAQSLISFQRTGSNTLIPLQGMSCDIEDLILRRSRRIGMILNSNELASIVHIPDRSIVSGKLRAYSGKTKKAPPEVIGNPFELGVNSHLGLDQNVTLTEQNRLRHMHIIGSTGMGKSNLLLNLIIQDIEKGVGLTLLDPHGDLVDEVIKHAPPERLNDIILLDPSDLEYPIGLNLLSTNSETEKIILSSDLVSLFKRFATSWGDQMTSVLSNAINAFLENPEGGTLIDLRRFLVETNFRNKYLEGVEDPNTVYYWKHEFQLLRANNVAPILTRLDTFLRPKLIRNMMAQKEGIDFRDVLDLKKILLVKLAQGLIGEDNSYLLGTLIVSKIHQAAQARQNVSLTNRTPHFFYIDEFQNFITPSMSAILSGARKYGLGLILVHQDLEQLARKDTELANSIISNPSIRICFRCGDNDAMKLKDGFSYFDATDLQNLKVGQAIVRVNQKDHDFNLSFRRKENVGERDGQEKLNTVIENCRNHFAQSKNHIESILFNALKSTQPTKKKSVKTLVQPSPKEEILKGPEIIQETKIDLEQEASRFIEKEVAKEKYREHRFLQEYVKRIGEERNFRAVIEESIDGGGGKVDVGLLRDNLKIACEISVTNTADYETQNISKCFASGYSHVFMISNDPKHLNEIRTLTTQTLNPTLHPYIAFIEKDDFANELDSLLASLTLATEIRAKGYRVKININPTKNTPEQDQVIKNAILSSLKRNKKED